MSPSVSRPHAANSAREADSVESARGRLIVALDSPDAPSALDLVRRLDGTCTWFKVGLELFVSAGPAILEPLLGQGYSLFLDLKFHDIPNTVAGAVRSVAGTGASLLTVHAGGGEKMMRAAVQAANTPGAPKLLAVTVLTSMDAGELSAVGVSEAPATQVLRLARLARTAGINGLVCSPQEVAAVRAAMGEDALLVTPGIRPGTSGRTDDQSRVATAADAIASGASMLVVGRPITQAADPAAAAAGILAEIQSAG
jgi:orotidine-5'-phosphate decarboxylase